MLFIYLNLVKKININVSPVFFDNVKTLLYIRFIIMYTKSNFEEKKN